MTQQKSHETIDSRIHAFLATKPTQKTLSDSIADLLHGKFGGRKESVQSNELVTWGRYER